MRSRAKWWSAASASSRVLRWYVGTNVGAHGNLRGSSATLGVVRRVVCLILPVIAGIALSTSARADNLVTESARGYEGYSAVEELSYEIFVEPSTKRPGRATVFVRQTLHNSANEMHDAVSTLGVPPSARVVGLKVARNGQWHEGLDADVAPRNDAGQRSPGEVFAQLVPPAQTGAVGAIEIVTYGIEGNATVQVEVELDVPVAVRGKRWELELPPRGRQTSVLNSERRISVRGLGDEHFWVDGIDSGGDPTIVVDHDEFPLIQWPAHLNKGPTLASNLEVTPDSFGEGGRFRLQVRLGQDRVTTPQHVVLLIDQSSSTDAKLQKHTRTMVRELFGQLPGTTTFDAIAFHRTATPLVSSEDGYGSVDDPNDVGELDRALASGEQHEGSDLSQALELAATRMKARGAKKTAIVVVTDGMMPTGPGAEDMESRFAQALGKQRRPELIFMVDDPLLHQRGVPGDHPVAKVAARLGARVTLQDLARTDQANDAPLLAAPRVLGQLSLKLPKGVTLDAPLPNAMIAGQYVVIEGHYEAKAPRSLRLKGRLGKKSLSVTAKARRAGKVPDAVAASLDPETDKTALAEAGFAFPEWYTRNAMQASRVAIERAGRNAAPARGSLTSDIFLRYLRQRVLPRSQACYRSAVNRDPRISGRVTFDFEIGKGEVMLASVAATELSQQDESFESCLEQAAWSMRVPKSSLDDQIYRVRYPVRFHAPEDAPNTVKSDAFDPIVDLLVDSAEILAQ